MKDSIIIKNMIQKARVIKCFAHIDLRAKLKRTTLVELVRHSTTDKYF